MEDPPFGLASKGGSSRREGLSRMHEALAYRVRVTLTVCVSPAARSTAK
jgi:hypothetical protein